MSLLMLIAAALGAWAWKTGYHRRLTFGDAAAILAALLALRLMTRGEWLPALVGLGWAGGWLWHRRRQLLPARTNARARGGVATPASMTVEEARGVLSLPPAADAAMIRSAHRRLILRVHPDAGGSAELARRVNAARDALISELNRSPPRAS
jgi:DnaJ family protein C protein 19